MSFLRIWLHCVWTTNRRIPYLRDDIRDQVIFHILETSRSKNIYIDHLNGYHEHLHALISLGSTQTISDIMRSIKGESSFWINKNRLTIPKFEWQDDYYAVSVGASQVDTLRKYIRNQADHHKSVTWEEELRKLEEEYDFVRIND
jgi:putative transposase